MIKKNRNIQFAFVIIIWQIHNLSLKSVINQLNDDYEVLVIDDGSKIILSNIIKLKVLTIF